MIHLLTGENNYEIRARRARILTEFREGKSEEAVTVVDGSAVAPESLQQLLLGVSLFAPEQLVVIDDVSAQKTVWEALAELLPHVGEGMDVLLVAPSADKRTKTYKWLQKNGEVITPVLLGEVQLSSWAQNKARELGIEIAPDVTRYIIEYTGGDQWQLSNDIQKLSLTGKPVTVELVREVLIPNPTSSAFDLLDAALAGKRDQVNQLLEGVRSHEDPYRFFGLLSNQIFGIIVIASAGNRPADTIAKDSGLHPFVVRKTQPLARRLSARERTHLATVAATTDMRLKSSGADPWVLITAVLKSISAR